LVNRERVNSPNVTSTFPSNETATPSLKILPVKSPVLSFEIGMLASGDIIDVPFKVEIIKIFRRGFQILRNRPAGNIEAKVPFLPCISIRDLKDYPDFMLFSGAGINCSKLEELDVLNLTV